MSRGSGSAVVLLAAVVAAMVSAAVSFTLEAMSVSRTATTVSKRANQASATKPGNDAATDDEVDPASITSISLQQTELFQGEMLRLKPHLRFIADGCVKLLIPPSSSVRVVDFTIQVWIDGKKISEGTGKLPLTAAQGSATLSATVRPADFGAGENAVEITAAVSTSDETTASRQTVRLRNLQNGYGNWFFTVPGDLKNDMEFPVWALATAADGATGDAQIGAENIADAVANHASVVLLKARVTTVAAAATGDKEPAAPNKPPATDK